jgi:hypothetical protein
MCGLVGGKTGFWGEGGKKEKCGWTVDTWRYLKNRDKVEIREREKPVWGRV